jgi:hypothetical protein
MTDIRRPHKYPNTLTDGSVGDVVVFRCAACGEWVYDGSTGPDGCPVDWRARDRVGELQANYDELHDELVAALFRVATLEALTDQLAEALRSQALCPPRLAGTRTALAAYEADKEASR